MLPVITTQIKPLLYWILVAVLDGLKYTTTHEWVKHEGDVATVGITDHAQVNTVNTFDNFHASFKCNYGHGQCSLRVCESISNRYTK
jgi:hypothetical protein